MLPENLIFISAQPHDLYFQWQTEVQITNFRKFGISHRMYILVWYPKNSDQLDNWNVIQRKYPEVDIRLYEDEGVNLGLYIPQLRPHTLKKFFKEEAILMKDKIFFYHDSDIIFNYLPNFEELVKGDICWQSDTSGYLDYDYLRRKEKQGDLPRRLAINKLADIGKISPEIIKSYRGNTGGAQYILRDLDYDFWNEVERQVLEIRKSFYYNVPGSINKTYFKSEEDGFQSWCADMWAINFVMWKRGQRTEVTKELDFSWATDSLDVFIKKPIFHNAGATKASKLFYKGNWINKSPINSPDLTLPSIDTASYMYVKAIQEVT